MADEEGEGGEGETVALDKELIFIVKMHEILVSNFEVSPVSMSIREDPDLGLKGAEFVLDYDLGYGESMSIVCRREGGDMLITLYSNDKEISHTVPLDSYVDDDFMPVVDEEYAKLVQDWFE